MRVKHCSSLGKRKEKNLASNFGKIGCQLSKKLIGCEKDTSKKLYEDDLTKMVAFFEDRDCFHMAC